MKSKLGAVGFIVGIIGAGFAAGAEPNTVKDWITVIGTAATSLMLMQVSIWMIKDEI